MCCVLVPRCNDECRHTTGQIDGEFSVSRFGLDRSPSLSVRIPNPITNRREVVHNGLAVAEDRLKGRFLVLVRSKVQSLGCQMPELWQILILAIRYSLRIKDVFTDRFN